MADDGDYPGAVHVAAADPDASAADFLPLDDSSNGSDTHVSPLNVQDEDGDDSASDVSMEAQTDDEDDANPPISQLQIIPADTLPFTTSQSVAKTQPKDHAAKKRKSPEDTSDSEDDEPKGLEATKKIKLEQFSKGVQKGVQGDDEPMVDKSALPAEIWHHIFTFCPPRSLGRLLLVNRLFNVYLDSTSSIHCDRPQPLSSGRLCLLQPNAIWQAARRRFWPNMPSPLQGKTELDMWQLSCSTSCQHCDRQGVPQEQGSSDLWQSGPGKDGVAIIWPFATRSCGTCLLANSIKEIDILLSSSIPSTLTAALPFVFVTPELHVISPTTMARGKTPADTSLTKLFWSAHVDDLKQEFFSVKLMGTATAEEWLKGLDGRGKERRNDPAKWENWALANGLSQMRTVLYPGYRPSAPAHLVDLERTPLSPLFVQIPGLTSKNTKSRAATPSASSSQRATTPDPCRRSSSGTASLPPGRQERTKEEVAELKATRKAEIERRALALDPPLPPNILAHIPSFQAALQIITPMDDQAWDLLKPRLLAQKAEAEQRDKESAAQARRQQELDEKRHRDDAAAKEARDVVDADWDEVQAPVRARIAGFADEIIRDGWENGEKVDRNNCSKFAVEVLTYIRKRFYAEVAKDAAAARAAGKPPIVDPPQGPFTQKLTLENMKWIFDIKVKPHTERHRKEIFLCNGCDVTVKYYGFEGVIQHYAAKHTNALSSGNVVVHWRAEWPEHPPFTSEQKTAKSGYYQGQPPSSYNAYQQGPPANPPRPYQAPPNGPTPQYGTLQYGETYPQGSQPPYPAQGYGPNPYPTVDPYHQPYPTAQGHAAGYSGPPSAPPVAPGPPGSAGQYNYNYGAYQTNSQVGYQAMQPSPFSHQYRTQLEDMARIARELWNATSNMKDTLSIVRVQVVIHHLAKRFHARHNLQLPLSTFIDGLSNHKDMRPVRNVNGLICRVCHQGVGGYLAAEDERRSYSLPQLTAHFQSRHVEPFVQGVQYGQPPEWTVDMVMLPEPAAVSSLRSVVSIDSQKYHLVNEAVPHLLGPASMPQAAPLAAPMWPAQTGYQMYQSAPADKHAHYYGPPQTDGSPALDGGAGPFHIAAPPAQLLSQPAEPYNYVDPPMARVDSIPPVNTYAPPEPAAALQSVALGRSNDSDRRSSQGPRPSREQNSRQSKKNKKKGTNSRDNGADAWKRTEDEEKMAEEEAEREGDAIRAIRTGLVPDRSSLRSPIPLINARDFSPDHREIPRAGTKAPSLWTRWRHDSVTVLYLFRGNLSIAVINISCPMSSIWMVNKMSQPLETMDEHLKATVGTIGRLETLSAVDPVLLFTRTTLNHLQPNHIAKEAHHVKDSNHSIRLDHHQRTFPAITFPLHLAMTIFHAAIQMSQEHDSVPPSILNTKSWNIECLMALSGLRNVHFVAFRTQSPSDITGMHPRLLHSYNTIAVNLILPLHFVEMSFPRANLL
ncbi:hypothetical protein VM1G_01505 [Cytospora mali]|uniref:F-box domain-containing protein n=1 Tax=Cytospora mali TaxID=578113 RepID=A0A194VQ35_CYTMA|nr:hypothetical protein VM1G_01505 [Valsa mali]